MGSWEPVSGKGEQLALGGQEPFSETGDQHLFLSVKATVLVFLNQHAAAEIKGLILFLN